MCELPEELGAGCDSVKTTMAFRAGEVIFREGAPCESVFAICDGAAKLVTSSTDGRTLLLRVTHPGEVLGLPEAVLEGAPFDCSAIAIEPSLVGIIPRLTFMRLAMSSKETRLAMNFALSEQYRRAHREAKFLAFGETSTIRLSRLLLEWSAERGEPVEGGVRIPIHRTHNDFAQAIGATRETVTRVLASLVHKGAVERRGRDILVVHPEILKELDHRSPRPRPE